MENNSRTKTILGLDLGTTSIGWAVVTETRDDQNTLVDAEIIDLGVRVVPLSTDEETDFEKGRPQSTNANRRLKRSARRNLQRYKLRRKNLIEILLKNDMLQEDSLLAETGKDSTHEIWRLRSKAARERIELEDLARVLLAINKKRGYKSNRKAQDENVGEAVDSMSIAKVLYENNWTPGQYAFAELKKGKKYIPDFYRSDLKSEFDRIWNVQIEYYPHILDSELYQALEGQGQQGSRKRFLAIKKIYTAQQKGSREEKRMQKYEWRARALKEQLDIEEVAFALVEINNDINKSSGYLGEISDRSKELFFNNITVGEYGYRQLVKNPHFRLRGKAYYRQDYLDEFEQIWSTQAQYHPQLTPELKEEIRDVVIFYQRKLKSQKGLLSFCTFENKQIDIKDAEGNVVINKTTGLPKTRTIGLRVAPKSSPLFQEFKIWQQLNNLSFTNQETGEHITVNELDQEIRSELFQELNYRGKTKSNSLLKLIGKHTSIGKVSQWKSNYDEVEGNDTNATLLRTLHSIAEYEGKEVDWKKSEIPELLESIRSTLKTLGVDPMILEFDGNLEGNDFQNQASYRLWHLLYSAQEDEKASPEDQEIYGKEFVNLKKKLHHHFGFKPEYAKMLSKINFPVDHGNVSTKAMRKILPYLQEGSKYHEACALAGYNHSHSVNKEQNLERKLAERLSILPKNSLRNPVVEKILNQMIHVVNGVSDRYGRPDQVRLELARELKKSAKERSDTQSFIAKNTKTNERIRQLIKQKLGWDATRNDIIRYKLWEELASNGHKTLFSGRQIPFEALFSKDIEIEHIIPKALLFDDSLSNKTLAFSEVNKKKSNRTGLDFMKEDHNTQVDDYIATVEKLYADERISKAKKNKLLMSAADLPDGFIERDLRNTQYIASKAREILQDLVRDRIVVTTGRITNRLRSDWNLINVLRELTLPTYRQLGLTETETRHDSGQEITKSHEVMVDWTKRDDHRHHAMDALAVAFTSQGHVNYLNYLNAKGDEESEYFHRTYGLEQKLTYTKDRKRLFISPVEGFRQKAKEHMERILISIKAKNKVVTKNINKTQKKGGFNTKTQLTPRGQLHKETVYGKIRVRETKPRRLNKKMTETQAQLIVDPNIRELILRRLAQYNGNPAKAFAARSLKTDPILHKNKELREVLCFEDVFTIRKDITPDLKLDKVVDPKIRKILEQRKARYGGDAKKAFGDLEKYPIWLNEEQGISIKRVTITGVRDADAIHEKNDHLGQPILDSDGKEIPVDYIQTGNNHHVAIYEDAKGKLQENVVSFYEVVTRALENQPIVDKDYNADLGWKFLFSLKQNEMFVFPNEADDFDPSQVDLMDGRNRKLISKNLFRVQKITSRDYMFNHHTNTSAITNDDLKNKKVLSGRTFHRINTPKKLRGIQKVRIDHLGTIVAVGENH